MKRAAREKTHERKTKMSDFRILRLILRTLIALAKAVLRIIGNNDAAQAKYDPAIDDDPELPSKFSE